MAEDHFAVLGEARRPWLDPEQVRTRFHALSRAKHPDQHAGGLTPEADAAFARLNAAHTALSDPTTRVRCLLETEYPEVKLAGPAAVPGTLAGLFAPMHDLLARIHAFTAKKASAPSALGRALLAREELAVQEIALARLAELEKLYAGALEDLLAFDRQWEPRPPDAAARLHGFYQRFAYLSRWRDQLREQSFQLGG